MNTKVRVMVTTGVSALVLATAALTMTPVGAVGYQPPKNNHDPISKVITKTENTNKAFVLNKATQNDWSGNVTVTRNHDISGNVASGSASNAISAATTIDQSNSIVADAPKLPTSSSRDKRDETKPATIVTLVDNSNSAKVINEVTQTANSGTATVTCNDDVTGNVTSGNVSNSATFTTTVIANN